MKKLLQLAITLLLLLICTTITVTAHPGRTDSKGGHYDRSTGEYHYHHGYPAHQHTDGVCPYNYDDQTDHNSDSGNNESNAAKHQTYRETKNAGFQLKDIVGLLFITPIFSAVCMAIIFLICTIKNKDSTNNISLTKMFLSSIIPGIVMVVFCFFFQSNWLFVLDCILIGTIVFLHQKFNILDEDFYLRK